VLFLGMLSLDGCLRHLYGVPPMVARQRDRGIRIAYVPAVDAAEAALSEGVEVAPVATLGGLAARLRVNSRR
jgi:magnesium chelatase family protein